MSTFLSFANISEQEKSFFSKGEPEDLKKCFYEEIIASVGYCFKCLSPDITHAGIENHLIEKVSFKHDSRSCACCVLRATGSLNFSTSIPITPHADTQTPASCSLIFQWISKSESLYVPDKFFTQRKQIKLLPIFIDLLPAFESRQSHVSESGHEYKTFIIPKRCNCCFLNSGGGWRKSMCLSEIHIIANEMSNKHRKCYRIIKLLLELMDKVDYFSYINQYYVKTFVLRHSRMCLDTSDDCVNRVLHIFHELQLAYEAWDLRSYHSNQKLGCAENIVYTLFQECIEKLCSVSTKDSLDVFARKIAPS